MKNDNGPMSAFICYCSTPRWIRCISYHTLLEMHIRSILFVSNVGNKSIWYVFWIDPTSIQYVEKAAENLSKMLTVLIVSPLRAIWKLRNSVELFTTTVNCWKSLGIVKKSSNLDIGKVSGATTGRELNTGFNLPCWSLPCFPQPISRGRGSTKF